MDNRTVGFFDSGLGGVSVLKEALAFLPRENYIYYGDNGNAPYGDRADEDIERLTLASVSYLLKRDAKAIVIACNTATATCIDQIRAFSSVPVISVEPAIKPACEALGKGKILMLATAATTRLGRYQALRHRMPDPDRVISVPCPGLVERIEQGIFAEDAFDDILDARLSPYEGETVDGIVLGCTHYIFIKKAIARYAAAHFLGSPALYDGNAATARQLKRVLEANALLNPSGTGGVEFCTSGDINLYRPIFERLRNSD